ncbi:MAG TPA: class I SAM-dependent methyltransferase [Methylomusa anaerophila]|uniref:Demethylspheroidene O-methyltransferase n=1 Tax=Methylomusa anaerophila TaxID=1930071 RepID=A0A348AFQ9_9FIRM|nr:class I SAM-dependent methyltransferase [Methylomusa anaerophila]BBB89907.1 demethylspheroidene O-methyltransferase [Methylomusa anaerophila]HML90567.1 class I SAM-dependent methyltransferase [Methylomusa anaerophila]
MQVNNLWEKLSVDPSLIRDLLAQGVVYELVAVAVKYRVFPALIAGKSSAALAVERNWDESLTDLVLQVLVQAGYLTFDQHQYRTTEAVNQYLDPAGIWFLGDSLPGDFPAESFGNEVIERLNRRTRIPGGHEQRKFTVGRLQNIGARALTNEFVQTTVRSVQLPQAAHLLDLGGGHGFYSIAFAQKYPALKVTLFDTPEVTVLASASIRAWGLESRISLLSGNFLADDIGSDYDVILCSLVLAPVNLETVLNKVRQALKPGGTLIVRSHISDAPPTLAGSINRLFCFLRGNHRLYKLDEWCNWLADYAFRDVKIADVNDIVATITAVKNSP